MKKLGKNKIKMAGRVLALGLVLSSVFSNAIKAESILREDAKGKYLEIDDKKTKGWAEVNDKWYFFNEEGYAVLNTWIGNYYLGKDGIMLTDTTTPDGYKVDKNGKWIPEYKAMWKQDNKGWWYQNEDGSYPKKEWKEISGNWYYFDGSGYMVSNTWIGYYYLGSDGAMLKNTTTPDGYKVDENGMWMYYEKTGTEVFYVGEVEETFLRKTLGNSGKFFKTKSEAFSYGRADREWFDNGYERFTVGRVKINGEIGYTVEFEKGHLKFDWGKKP